MIRIVTGTPGPEQRRWIVATLVVVGLAVGLLMAWHHFTHGPIRKQLRTEATALRQRAVDTRTDPTATGQAAVNALAKALAGQERVKVLTTSTDSHATMRVKVSLWTSVDDGEFSFDDPTIAETCLTVSVTPGAADGTWWGRGTVAVKPFSCPPRVALEDGPGGELPPHDLPQERISLVTVPVPPPINQYEPCYSGSNNCN